MKPSMLAKLEQLAERLHEVSQLLIQEGITNDMEQYRKLNREHAELEPVVALYHQYQQALSDQADAQEMLADPEMKAFAQDEIQQARERMEQLQKELQTMLLPKDPNDEKIFCWKSVLGPAVMKLLYLPAICCGCTHAMQNDNAGRLN
jgi:peptide chain release factor 1